MAQAVFKKQSFKRVEKELAHTRRIDRCLLVNWTARNIRRACYRFMIRR